MKRPLKPITAAPAAVIAFAMTAGIAAAGQVDLCVNCSQPDQTYVCRVDIPRGNVGDEALQLYCIVKTAKDGGHKTCAIKRGDGTQCAGPVRTYTYGGPPIPDAARSATGRLNDDRFTPEAAVAPDAPKQKGGEPETLVEMTSRAVGASKKGLRTTGEAVVDAAGGTGRTIGKIGKKAGKQVGKTARGAKSAVRYAYDCVFSFFRDCGTSESE